MEKSLSIASIRIDGGTQPRASISQDAVGSYAECFTAGAVLPPIDVFFDGVEYWLADGFHRLFAAKSIERLYLTATIHTGTRRDAVLFSVGANIGHGLQRTNSDKRKAATTLLMDDEWAKWSNTEIAKRCGVSEHLVRDQRQSLRLSRSEGQQLSRTYTTKHGTEATMNVGRIGKGDTRAARQTVYEAKVAAAVEGASKSSLRSLPSKRDAEVIARAMQTLDGIVGALANVDRNAIVGDARAEQWCATANATISAMRSLIRQLERKTA